jgi:glycosyltransferase involved in cell wall biosynthesis
VLTVYDLAFRVEPSWMPDAASEYDRRLRAALERADHVVTISESTRQDLLRFYDIAPERVTAVLLGVAPPPPVSAFPPAFPSGVRSPFILAVGTLEPRKNHLGVIKAFERLDCPHQLVIAGARGWKDEGILAAIERSPRRDQILRLDYVDADVLDGLYRGADLLAYPSLYEGFGLPILEAMARGCPVVTGNGSSLPEVGGDAAVYVDPRSVDELAAAMERLLGDAALREQLVTAGRARAAAFTWRRTADGTAAVYRRLIG